MVTRLDVELGERGYPIIIGTGLLSQLGALTRERLPGARQALIITDEHVARHHLPTAQESLTGAGFAVSVAVIPSGEASKSLAMAGRLYDACAEAGLERSAVIIALGGGVVGDLAGFVAATYLRGIDFVQVPTTLLAQVDSSVGGKTGIDLPAGKNLVGTFHQPVLVAADPGALLTLPRREFVAGLAEGVKHAVIRDGDLFARLEEQADAILSMDPAILGPLVQRNCAIKASVVAADEREGGLRAILNFGHTIGHAVEAHQQFRLLHGECVAIGMVAAARLSAEVGVLQEADLIRRLVTLLGQLGLPTALPDEATADALLPYIHRDKKVTAGRVRWVLPVRLGEVITTPDVSDEAVRRVLRA